VGAAPSHGGGIGDLRAIEGTGDAGARDFVWRYLSRLSRLPQREVVAYTGHDAP